jgi:Uma2 family endonuclease
MSTATLSPAQNSSPGEPYKITLEKFEEMIRLGLIDESDRVVLLDGLMVTKMGRNERHLSVTRRIFRLVLNRVPSGWAVLKEDPIKIPIGPAGDSRPEPDVTILKGSIRDYDTRIPGPDDVVLVIEVADSTLDADRKGLGRYAWAGLTAWIVNLNNETIEIYTRPTGMSPSPGYAGFEVKRKGEMVTITDSVCCVLATLSVDEIMEDAEVE